MFKKMKHSLIYLIVGDTFVYCTHAYNTLMIMLLPIK